MNKQTYLCELGVLFERNPTCVEVGRENMICRLIYYVGMYPGRGTCTPSMYVSQEVDDVFFAVVLAAKTWKSSEKVVGCLLTFAIRLGIFILNGRQYMDPKSAISAEFSRNW